MTLFSFSLLFSFIVFIKYRDEKNFFFSKFNEKYHNNSDDVQNGTYMNIYECERTLKKSN